MQCLQGGVKFPTGGIVRDRVLIICEGRVAGELKPEASDEEYGLMMSSAHVSKEKEA